MGYEVIGRWSVRQVQQHIRRTALSSHMVILTKHARAQMGARRILDATVHEVLRQGAIHKTPEPNASKGSLECQMERYCAGSQVGVVVALCDESPALVVVTAMHVR